MDSQEIMLYNDAAVGAGTIAAVYVYVLIMLALMVVTLVGLWKVFTKAGKPGWAAIVPFYNLYCLFEMSFGNGWLFLLTFVPCVNIVIQIMMNFKLAKSFGKGVGFGFGLLFFNFIFMMILGFGDAEYVGPNA